MNAFTATGLRQISAPAMARQRAAGKRARRAAEKAPDERAALNHGWRSWRRERLETLLAGPHGPAAGELIAFLAAMTLADAAALLARVAQGPWREADANTRFEILALIDDTIVELRERAGLAPFSDPLPGQPPNVFLLLREALR
jgi:hypothetical protein